MCRITVLALTAILPLAALAGCSQAEQDQAKTDASQAASDAGKTASSLGDQASEKAKEMEPGVKEQLANSSQDVRETTIRNAVANAGPGEFKRKGHDIDGVLECTATSPEMGKYTVDCKGNTKAAKPVTLTGNDPGEGDATFVGSVDSAEVFRQNCVGVC